MELLFREMTEDDLPAVLEIENASFTTPWTEDGFRSSMAQEYSLLLCAFAKTGSEATADAGAGTEDRDGCLVGYCCAMRSFDEAEIPDIAIAPGYRGQGCGRALLSELMRRENEQGVEHFTLEVRKSNAPAIALYRSLGFEVCGEQKNFYSQPKEDALILWKDPPAWLTGE